MGPNGHRPVNSDEGGHRQLASSTFLFSSFLGYTAFFKTLILAF